MAMEAMAVQVRVPPHLYQRLEQTARLTQYAVQEVMVSALEAALPLAPETLPKVERIAAITGSA